jgi:hypothetical protein
LSLSFSYSNPRRGGFPTPRAQFINNGFGLGEFLGKRGLTVLAVSSECAVRDAVMDQLPNVLIKANNAGNATRIKTIETMSQKVLDSFFGSSDITTQ